MRERGKGGRITEKEETFVGKGIKADLKRVLEKKRHTLVWEKRPKGREKDKKTTPSWMGTLDQESR